MDFLLYEIQHIRAHIYRVNILIDIETIRDFFEFQYFGKITVKFTLNSTAEIKSIDCKTNTNHI